MVIIQEFISLFFSPLTWHEHSESINAALCTTTLYVSFSITKSHRESVDYEEKICDLLHSTVLIVKERINHINTGPVT